MTAVSSARGTRVSLWRLLIRHRLALIGSVMIFAVCMIAVIAPWVAPYDPNEVTPRDRYSPPGSRYLLGTDNLGRDVLSRILHGTRVSLSVGVLSVFLGMVPGVALGTFAAFKGGKLDSVVTEVANMLVAFPTILLGITILSIWGGGFTKLVITLALAYFPRFVRLSRAQTLSIREKEFVEAARALGKSDLGIVFRHVLPNTASANIVAGTLWISAAILSETALSFLGLGVAPPTATWGGMIRDGMRVLMVAPWIPIYPSVAIVITVVGFNMVGDAIRDLLDPRTKRVV